jgi:uncharacterized protein (TIGR03663 family)
MMTLEQNQTPASVPETLPFTMPTVETILYATFFLIALSVRLFLLDYLPLDANEAQQAMASWNFIRAVPDAFTGSPMLFAGNAIVFLLFGATDMAARILPALFGSLLVLFPTLLRRDLGRAGALIASALMIYSPSLVLFSRQADGAIIGVTCGLAAIAFASRYFDNHTPRELYLATIAFALALLSSSQVWTIVLAMVLFVLVARIRREAFAIEKNDARNAALIFVLVFVGVATVFMFRREGLGVAFNLFGAWLDTLRLSTTPLDPLRLLVLYEPIVLFFGIVAAVDILFATRGTSWLQSQNALMMWGLVSFLLYSFTGEPEPARAVCLVVPFALMAGWFIGMWWSRLVDAVRYAPEARSMILSQEAPVFFLAIALSVFLSIIVAEFALRGNLQTAETLMANLRIPLGAGNAGLVVVLTLFIVAFSAIAFLAFTTLGFERTGYLGVSLALTLMAAWTFRQSMMLNFTLAPNAYEWLTPRIASPNARDLRRDVENISRWRANDSHDLAIVVDDSLGAMAAWNLREFRNARFVARPRADATIPAMLLPVNAPAPAGWIGQAYTLEVVQGKGLTPGVLRWLFYRDMGSIESINAVLWTPPPQ